MKSKRTQKTKRLLLAQSGCQPAGNESTAAGVPNISSKQKLDYLRAEADRLFAAAVNADQRIDAEISRKKAKLFGLKQKLRGKSKTGSASRPGPDDI